MQVCGEGTGERQEQRLREQLRGCSSSLLYHGGSEDRVKGMSMQYLWEIETMGLADIFSKRSEGRSN